MRRKEFMTNGSSYLIMMLSQKLTFHINSLHRTILKHNQLMQALISVEYFHFDNSIYL